MNKNTPKRNKSLDGSNTFSPITLPTSPAAGSPQKNLTGPPRIIRDIIADLYNNIQKWNLSHIKSCGLVKQIASIKADEPKLYSAQLEEYINELYMVVQSVKDNNDFFAILIKQTEAFAKLPHVNNPIFFSLDALSIAELVRRVCEAYQKEFQVKQFILENIAHSKTKHEVMFLAAYWTHQLNVESDSVAFNLECLLVESGHRPVK